MPYVLRKAPRRLLYWVVTKETGQRHSIDPLPKARAEAQRRALYARERGYPPKVRRGGVTAANKRLVDDMLHQPADFNGRWQNFLPHLQRQVNFITGKDVLNAADYEQMGHSIAAAKRAVENVRNQETYEVAIRFLRNMWGQFAALKPEVKTPQPSPPSSPKGRGQAQSRRRQSSVSSQGIDEVLIAPEFQELHDFLKRELEGFRGGMPFATDALVYMCGPPGLVFDFLSQRGLLPFPLGEVELEHWMRMVLFLINAYREESRLSWRHEGSGRRRPRRGGRENRPPVELTPPPPPPPPEEEFDLYQLPPEEEFTLIHPVVQYFVEFLDWVIEHPDGYTPFFLYARLNQALNHPLIQDLLFGLEVNMTIQNYENFPNSEEFLGYMLDWMRDTIMRIEEWMADNNLRFNEDVTYFTPPF